MLSPIYLRLHVWEIRFQDFQIYNPMKLLQFTSLHIASRKFFFSMRILLH